jgi:hypothetical protein
MPIPILQGLLAAPLTFAVPLAVSPGAGREVYPPAFFAPYAPQTALDMVERLPGFRLDLGDAGIRGFSEAGGNVLVDGGRPASKSGGLAAVLAAIPAGQVERIEIVRSGASTSEASGQAVVANIVRVKRSAGLAASAALSRGERRTSGKASLTATLGLGRFELASRTTIDAPGERSHGTRAAFDLAGGARGRERLSYDADFPELTQRLTLSGALAGGEVKAAATLTRAWLSEGFAFADDALIQRFPKRTGRWRGEVGGDWSRSVAGAYGLKILALASITDLDARSWSEVEADGKAAKITDRFESRAVSRETIVRAVLARGGQAALRPEFGVEIAWNDLDSRSASAIFGQVATRSTSAVAVSETRGQAFATLNWRPAPRWTLTAGAAYETSRIEAGGEGGRRFGVFKPSLIAAYRPDDRSDLRLSVRRSVGQLSFGDFAASANLAEGKASDGNAALRPDHRMTAALNYDRRFGRRGAFSLTLSHDWRGDVLEAGVLPSGAFGVVNVRRARAWSVSANLEAPIDPILPGGTLRLRATRQDSRLADPITRARRRLNGFQPTRFEAELRQDRAAFSWGVDYAAAYRKGFWYADEARVQDHGQDLGLFVETRRFHGARTTLRLDGLTGTRNTYRRALYASSRAGAASGREVWDIRTPLVGTLSVSRNF